MPLNLAAIWKGLDHDKGWQWRKLFNLDDRHHLITLALSTLFFFPIIYAQAFHADDAFRVATGTYDWYLQGRSIADNVAKLYSLGVGWIQDITPLNWVLSIFLVALGANALRNRFALIHQAPFAPALIGLLFIFNPYFVENMLYRFDSIGMALALLLAVLSFCTRRTILNCALAVFLLWVSLNLYQPFSNLFLGLLGIELLFRAIHKPRWPMMIKQFALGVLILLIAYGLYYGFVKLAGYSSGRMDLVPIGIGTTGHILSNLLTAFGPFAAFWQSAYMLLLVPGVFVVVALGLAVIRRDWSMPLGTILCAIVIFGSGLGFMALLQQQFLAPRALAYFPLVMILIALCVLYVSPRWRWVMLLPVLVCFFFSYRVGNVHQLQTAFERPVFAQLAVDIYRVGEEDALVFQQVGEMPIAPNVRPIIKHLPFAGFLERPNWQTYNRSAEFTGPDRHNFRWTWQRRDAHIQFQQRNDAGQMELIEDASPYYALYRAGQEGFVVWKQLNGG